MTPAHGSLATRLALAAGLLALGAPAVAQPTTAPAPTPAPTSVPTEAAPSGDAGAVAPPAEAPVPTPDPTLDPTPVPPPPPAKDEPPALGVTYDKGIKFETADNSFEAKLALRSQWRLEVSRPTTDGAETSAHFVIPRLRLQLEGHAFGTGTRYKLEAGLEERGSFSFVKDFFVEHKVGPGWLRVGQWKRPFNRQELVSDFGSTLNERALTAELVGGGRDLGIAFHNDYEASPEGVEWVVGVFNGFSGGADRPKLTTTCEQDPVSLEITCTNGTPSNFPADFGPTVAVRAGYNHGKVKGYTEGDLDGGPLRYAIGVNYKVDLADLSKGSESSVGKNLSHAVGVDAIAKVNGLDVELGAFLVKVKSADALLGAMIQAGYMVVPKTMQVALRGAVVDIAGSDNKEVEVRGAFNYYMKGHAWKVATDAGILKETGGGDPEIQVRSMVQLTF